MHTTACSLRKLLIIIKEDMMRVVNVGRDKFDVYIGRGSKWGNRFVIGRDGNRDDVIKKYREWIMKNDELMKCLIELKDKVLGCYCKPLACHGDVLVELCEEKS